jgi:16S rRNA pseudouridine516 synthase
VRLDKFLSNAGVGTRSEVKVLIKKGFVTVNKTLIKSADFSVHERNDEVKVEDQLITFKAFVYIMLNKPEGYLSATTDPNEKTVMDLIDDHRHRDLHIVGRLDKYTTGILLITDDGLFTHQLTAPKFHVEKQYEVVVDRALDNSLIDAFQKGVKIDDYVTLPAQLTIHGEFKASLIIHEGKFHQVKRMFEAFGSKVTSLHRSRFGSLTLENLEPGSYRELTTEEYQNLIASKKK